MEATHAERIAQTFPTMPAGQVEYLARRLAEVDASVVAHGRSRGL